MKFSDCGSRESLKRNLYVILFTAVIYLSIPFTKSLSNFLISHNLFRLSAYILISLFILISIYIIFKRTGLSLINIFCVLIFFAVYIYVIQRYRVPSKKIHFIEYGILTSLVYHSFKLRIKKYSIYPLAFLTAVLIGLGDELIQFFIPDRHCSFQDVLLNGISSALIIVLIFIFDRPGAVTAEVRSDH